MKNVWLQNCGVDNLGYWSCESCRPGIKLIGRRLELTADPSSVLAEIKCEHCGAITYRQLTEREMQKLNHATHDHIQSLTACKVF